ncbi:hypothetical protein [Streptomyces sp. MBT55]|uniref:hypothetical protein n=1 Tax=Streptomyces sp. MBT55 TaxID=1488386 RepID=UPI001914933C|nr:hypothetical protein [Streptomyces sp. MBT55]MBK6040828.1 hypothetical protein [Streptomyces sp. MBT55]
MTADPTREEIQAGIEAQICPWCGKGPFKILAGHTTRLHGVDRLQLRDLAGLLYRTPVCDPSVTADYQERNQRFIPTPPGKGYRKVLSEAAKEANRRRLDAHRSIEQQRAATTAAHTPEAKAKRSETIRKLHAERRGSELRCGDYRRYATGCRCEACRADHARYFREMRAEIHCATCGHDRDSHNGETHIGYCTSATCNCRRWRNGRAGTRSTIPKELDASA